MDPDLIPGSGRSPGEGIVYPFPVFLGGSDGKESACDAGELGSVPGLEKSPGEENNHPHQYPCLENSTDRGAWWTTVHGVAESRKQLSDFHFLSH